MSAREEAAPCGAQGAWVAAARAAVSSESISAAIVRARHGQEGEGVTMSPDALHTPAMSVTAATHPWVWPEACTQQVTGCTALAQCAGTVLSVEPVACISSDGVLPEKTSVDGDTCECLICWRKDCPSPEQGHSTQTRETSSCTEQSPRFGAPDAVPAPQMLCEEGEERDSSSE